ncbi:efflux RND transporter permease subunit [Leucobacter sp. UT-8R-CII-1-4]|uniref:efflux RND transporter permease subunit n=1 Tax=Leucobacter sp. UT-8R-CII-1-4 TaxID=3040075 RepID=UPI0024A97E1F|nr:efflux RND transporter permease subunit [Leucobacter sp. UT-8R-CII-1-4]MDI6022476.1 efflux RND transporter permease subunit [Leucobacter sp. UT-8R-CII-1-4]
MHLLAKLSLKNRALIALVTIVASVFGLIGVSSLKQELMPSVQFPAIVVVSSYAGASPEVVKNDVSGPIETALRGVPGLEQTTATSTTGASMVLAQFTYGVDLAVTEQKVERAVARISSLLPESVDPQVMSGSLDDMPIVQISVTPPKGGDPEETARLVERIAIPELNDLSGVREAQLQGARGDRVTITPDTTRLNDEYLTKQSITDALQQSGALVAAGSITEEGRTLAVQAGSKLSSVDEIRALPLVRDPGMLQAKAAAEQAAAQAAAAGAGRSSAVNESLETQAAPETEAMPVITLGEVAEVTLEANPQRSISRVNGEPALTIAVTKASAANTVDVSHTVRTALADIEPALDGAKLSVVFDQAPYVERSIETLTTEGLLGLLFAVIVILVFLMSVRATIVTAISIPVSVLLTFVGLNFADYTLNMLTLGALTISIGRVVDDSIVVIENIKRHLSDAAPDADRAATIVTAVREVAGAITASTITTVAVFLPMAFVSGMVGELFRPFAFTVTIALAASLLVALTIVPVLAYWFLRNSTKKEHIHEEEHATAMQRGYLPIVKWTLKHPAVTLLVAVVVFGGTLAATPLMKTNFMGSDEQNSVGLTQTLAPGTSLDAQLEQVERVEAALDSLSAVQTVQVTIGSSGSGMGAIFGAGGDGVVSYSITTDPDAVQSEVQDQIRTTVAKLEDAGEFSVGSSGGGVTMSSSIEVVVTAPDQETLAEASDQVVAALDKQEGLKQVESDLAASRPYLAIVVDRAKASEVGLSEVAVASMVSQQMQPRQIGQIVLDNTSVSIYLSQGVAPNDQASVAALTIQTAAGERRLDELATVEVADGPVTIRTQDTNRTVTVTALPAGNDLRAASTEVNAALESTKLPAGASASVGGVMSQQSEAFEQLGLALLAAILIVYVVMVATFKSLLQPLLLLVSVPFAATGALILLIATGMPLGVASLIGVLMLVGIVVTNAIVLIDLVNQQRERGKALLDAVISGSSLRLRPIVMTALATILALTPMGIGITGSGGFISQPLAVVVIGGLLSSTVLTLIVLPTLYYAVESRRERAREHRAAKRAHKAATHAEGEHTDGRPTGLQSTEQLRPAQGQEEQTGQHPAE